jgi:hypothetical protein
MTNKLILGSYDNRFSSQFSQARFLKNEEIKWKTSNTSPSIQFKNGVYGLRLVKSQFLSLHPNVLKKQIKN